MSDATAATSAVLEHHLGAMGVGLDEVMKDYDENSVLITPDGTAKGLDEIRAFFGGFMSNMPPDMMEKFTMVRMEAVNEAAYILWKAEPYVVLGTDTFFVRDGKIVYQTYAVQAGS